MIRLFRRKEMSGEKLNNLETKTYKRQTSIFDEDWFIYSLVGITILFVLIARLHLLSFPFERDEGEYAYMGKLILDGHPPYTLAYNMKFPGTNYMYALIMGIFGESIVGVHLGLIFIVLTSMLLVFQISRHFVSKIAAVVSTATFGILGTSWTLLGQAAHATHFVVFFALLGIYVLLELSNKHQLLTYFIAGFFFSLAFICKQSGLFFVLFGAVIIVVREYKDASLSKLLKNLLLFSLGFATPLFIMIAYFYLFGDFDKFWFWTVKYLLKYGGQVPVSMAPENFKVGLSDITSDYTSAGYIGLWIVALIGIPFIFIKKNAGQNKIILFSFLLFSFLTILPGFYFRSHYFITLLPVVGLLIAIFFDYFNDIFIQKFKKPNLIAITLMVFTVIAGSGIWANKEYLFSRDPQISCKQIHGSNPFVESLEIAKFIEQNTAKDDKIAVLGSEPQICFYANRYSATGYVYTYNLVELHSYALSMQKEMIKEIEASQPKFMVFVKIRTSWLVGPKSEMAIFDWANEYIRKNYNLVALMDVNPKMISTLKFREQLNNYNPQSTEFIYIYEKNE